MTDRECCSKDESKCKDGEVEAEGEEEPQGTDDENFDPQSEEVEAKHYVTRYHIPAGDKNDLDNGEDEAEP